MPTVWTQDEIAQVRAAIMALATGSRPVTVSYAGPPARSVTYSEADLEKLQALLAQMVATTGTGTTYRLGATNKGLGR